MSKTLDEIRKKLQALDTRKGQSGGSAIDKTVYPHWNIPEGTSAVLRFLPDGNEDNTFFWAERQMIKLEYPGIKGQDERKAVEVLVPCVEMWDGKNTCPILNEVRPMWKGDQDMQALARKYWIKRTYFMQGLVRQDPMNESDAPDNPIRKLMVTSQLFTLVRAALMDPDMEHNPVDYINGTDFMVSKSSKGGFADYSTSKWARKESSLTDAEMSAIERHKLVDLSTYLPKRPSSDQMGVIFEMFQASLEGEMYDPSKWATHFKPYGFDGPGGNRTGDAAKTTVAVSRPTVTAPVVTKTADPVEHVPAWEDEPADVAVAETASTPAPSTNGTKTPQEILAMLRNRNKQ